MASFQDPPTQETATCHLLPWDSEFFRKRIARADLEHVTEVSLPPVTRWCSENSIDCLYLLAPSDDQRAIRLLESSGFRLVDLRTTLNLRINGLQSPVSGGKIRNARVSDIPMLRAVAAESHRDSRFFSDGHFPDEKCRALYETWIEKSVNGSAAAVLVAELADKPVGYITCNLCEGSGEIGLLGCLREVQGQGIGRDLINASLNWFSEQGVAEVAVVTQGRNIRAQRAYQRAGFITRSVQLWFHYWPLG